MPDGSDISSDATVAVGPGTADISSDATVAASGSRPPEAAGGAGPDLPLVEPAVYATDTEIARGGMGRILSATDRRLGRPVALKELLAPGPEAAARFRREALITARLQHPAIVPVYEAGRWPSGEPFYAMKLVAGRPLDRVVAACKTLEERLALLPSVAAVCDAIAYAHGQRIVHRDLKPSNVLIGDYGETVVIDWGLAKDLDHDDAPTSDLRTARDRAREPRPAEGGTLTLAGAVMGTPAYMPPEQARGDAVDARADVFALGAMLYHVLAGQPPYAARSATEVIAQAVAGKVIPLRDRAPRAPADLVTIVERAMAQDPDARYPTAKELAEELRRFQTGQLVGAHRYTTWERVTRFVRKHRAAVTIGAIATVAFAVLGTVAVQRIVEERDRAEAARTLAERRRDAAEKLVDFMVSDMRDRLDAVGQLALMSGLGENLRDYYAALSDLPGGMRDEDVDRMARALDILGAAERQSGDLDAALATFEDARTRLRALVAASPGAPETPRRQGAIASATVRVGQIHQARGRMDEALAAYHEAATLFAEARGRAPRDRALLRGAAQAHDQLGDLYRNRGEAGEAIAEYGRARSLRHDALTFAESEGAADELLAIRFDLSTSEMKLGSAEQARGATDKAAEHYRAAVTQRRELAAANPDRVAFQHGLSYIQGVYAALLRETGDLREALAAYEADLATLDQLVRKDPDNTEWRRDRGNALADIGYVLYDLGDARGALERYAAAIANHELLLVRDPENAPWHMDVSRTHTRAGDAHLHAGDVDAALGAYREARRLRQAQVARDPKNVPWRRALAWSHHKLAGALPFAGDRDGALAAAREALALREALVAEAPGSAGYRNELALSGIALGRLLLARGEAGEAIAALDRAVTTAQALVDQDAVNLEWKETLVNARIARGEARLARGDAAAAAEDAAPALALAETHAAARPELSAWQVLLAEAHWLSARAGGPRAAHVEAARRILRDLDRGGRLGFEKRDLARAVGGVR